MDSFMDFARKMQEKYEKINNIITEELEDKATMAVAESQARCPVKTGALRSSIHDEPLEKKGDTYSIDIGSELIYAPKVEDGYVTTKGNIVLGRHMIADSIEIYQRELDRSVIERIGREVGND
jgi:hypothetical protein